MPKGTNTEGTKEKERKRIICNLICKGIVNAYLQSACSGKQKMLLKNWCQCKQLILTINNVEHTTFINFSTTCDTFHHLLSKSTNSFMENFLKQLLTINYNKLTRSIVKIC